MFYVFFFVLFMCWPGLFLTIMGPNIVSDWYMDMMYDSPLWYDMSALKISVLLSTLITLTVCHMILRWVWGIYHSVSLYICVHVHIHGCVSSRIVSTPWRIKWFLLQIVAFIEIYEHARLDTHTHAHTHWQSERWVSLKSSMGMEGRKAKEIGGKANLWATKI